MCRTRTAAPLRPLQESASSSIRLHLAVEVIPAAFLPHEATGFVHADGRPAADTIARNEFDDSVVAVQCLAAEHLQPQPLRLTTIGLQLQRGRPARRMP